MRRSRRNFINERIDIIGDEPQRGGARSRPKRAQKRFPLGHLLARVWTHPQGREKVRRGHQGEVIAPSNFDFRKS